MFFCRACANTQVNRFSLHSVDLLFSNIPEMSMQLFFAISFLHETEYFHSKVFKYILTFTQQFPNCALCNNTGRVLRLLFSEWICQ